MALRPKLNRVWTSNNSVARRDPGDAKYLQGWVAEIPTYQVLNYLQYKVDTTMLAQAERGIFEWGGDVSYGVGSLAWDETNKTIYVCTVTNPSKTLAPSANPSQWSPSAIQVSRANYDSVVSAINSHIANMSNPHQVTAAQVGTYNRAEMDALVSNYRAMVLAHASDYNNPHNLTAVQVGAVPATGGAYTGQVTMPTAYFNESKTAQLLQDNGMWLRNGNYFLGINGTTGNAEVGTASSKSPVVTDLTFPTLKAAYEPGYAVPEPIVNMPLIGSINMRAGIGKVYGGIEPTYAPQFGNALVIRHNVGFGLDGIDEILSGGRQATLAIDAIFSGTPSGGGGWLWDFGLRWFTILVTPNRGVLCEIKSTTGTVAYSSNVTMPMNEWVRIVATYNATIGRVCLYINGVKAFDLTPSNLPTTGFREGVVYHSAAAAFPNISTYLRNFRVWADELTDKQVSTL